MPEKLKPVHPGEILREEFMRPLGLSVNRLALELRVPVTRMAEIVNRRRSVTSDTALRLARLFGTTPEFWLNLQALCDLETTRARQQRQERTSPDYRHEAVREEPGKTGTRGPTHCRAAGQQDLTRSHCELAKYTGLPANQVRARGNDAINDKFAQSSRAGTYRAIAHKVEPFLDELSGGPQPKAK